MKVLHVPFTYFPDICGGTEVYVSSLAQRLSARGHWSAIAAPGDSEDEYQHDGLSVYRFQTDRRRRVDLAYGVPDEVAAAGFRNIINRLRPQIVHLHARTAAVSERLIDEAHQGGALTVFTYHTPTASCPRGTMMLRGERACDGRVEAKRCTACALSALGVPDSLATLLATIPGVLSSRTSTRAFDVKPLSYLRVPTLIATDGERFRNFIRKVDHVVAVCQWAKDVLERNGVPPEKTTLSRHGISATRSPKKCHTERRTPGPIMMSYFGRINPTKGIDLLVEALALVPDIDVKLDIYLIHQPGSEEEFRMLVRQARLDSRISLRRAVPSDQVCEIMSAYDLVAVPSRWLETGPLVVLQAFSVGVPVLGANHGGIAELVRDGVDGLLFTPNDVRALANTLARIVVQPTLIEELRKNIRPPRTQKAVVDDMLEVYEKLFGCRNVLM